MRLYIDKGGGEIERERGRREEEARPHVHIWAGRGYRARRGDPIIPRRCHEIASELYSIRVARPIARRFRTLEETSLHFGLSRPGLKLLHRDRRQSVTVADDRQAGGDGAERIVLSTELRPLSPRRPCRAA